MSSRNTRRLVFAVLVLGLLALFRLWIDQPSRDKAASRVSPSNVSAEVAAGNPTRADATVSGTAAVSRDATSATEAVRGLADERMQLQVHAPSDVKVGDVFDTQIDFRSNGGIRKIAFLVNYDQHRLALVGWSDGNFAQQAGVPAQLGAEEPSDGNIQVSLKIGNGLAVAGPGTLVVFQFEAIKAGTAVLTLQNLAVIDRNGGADSSSARVNDGSVTIHE
jgi:hypothetical protein